MCGWWNDFSLAAPLPAAVFRLVSNPDPSGYGFETISRLAGSYWWRRHSPAALLAVHWGCVLAACLYCGAWCDVASLPVTKHVFPKDLHVFCVDISPSMAQPGRHGDSHLEISLKVMNQIVQQKVLHVMCGRERLRPPGGRGVERPPGGRGWHCPHPSAQPLLQPTKCPMQPSCEGDGCLPLSADVYQESR